MSLRIGDEALNLTAETTEGRLDFHQWIGDGWAILFSHPKDFTPVCTTELGYMAKLQPEFDKRNAKVIGLSIDPVDDHKRWAKDIEETQGAAPELPDHRRPRTSTVAKLYDMIHPNASAAGKRTAADNATVRSVFVIGPDKKVKLMLTYPMSTGRNFDEVLRVLDSIQLTAQPQGRDARELEAGRGRDHRRLGLGRGREEEVSAGLEDAASPTCGVVAPAEVGAPRAAAAPGSAAPRPASRGAGRSYLRSPPGDAPGGASRPALADGRRW